MPTRRVGRVVTAGLMLGLAGCSVLRVGVPEADRRLGPAHAERGNTITFKVEPAQLPSLKPSADRGQAAFNRNLADGRSCASCHGVDGKPLVAGAPDLSQAAWIRGLKPGEVRDYVDRGEIPGLDTRHAAGAHAFGEQLSLQEQWDLTAWCRFLSISADKVRDTQTLKFGKNCNVCHGNKGFGNGFLAPTMEPQPRNLSDFQAWGMQRSDNDIFNNIYYGVHWSAMPPWRSTLPPADIWDIVDFIRSLQYELPESSSAPAGPAGAAPGGK